MIINTEYRTEKMCIEIDISGYIHRINIVNSETMSDQETFYNELTDFVMNKFIMNEANLGSLILCFIKEYVKITNTDGGDMLNELANGRIVDYDDADVTTINIMELLKNPFYKFIEALIRNAYDYSYAKTKRKVIKGMFLTLNINYLGVFGNPDIFFDIIENHILKKWINELTDKNNELEKRFASTFDKD